MTQKSTTRVYFLFFIFFVFILHLYSLISQEQNSKSSIANDLLSSNLTAPCSSKKLKKSSSIILRKQVFSEKRLLSSKKKQIFDINKPMTFKQFQKAIKTKSSKLYNQSIILPAMLGFIYFYFFLVFFKLRIR